MKGTGIMQFSEFLESRRETCRDLITELKKIYPYASILGTDQNARSIRVNKNSSAIAPGMDTECGFVVKVSNGQVFFEYSLDDVGEDALALAKKISTAFRIHESLTSATIGHIELSDEPLVESFSRPGDFDRYTEQEILDFCQTQCKAMLAKSEHLLNAYVSVSTFEVSKLFISANRELDQHYTWVNGGLVAIYRDNDKVVQVREGSDFNTIGAVLAELPTKMDAVLERAHKLTLAKPIVPGVYDVNYRVRLVDAKEYGINNVEMLKGFLSGLHAGNFDITNVYVDNLYKTIGKPIGENAAMVEEFVAWAENFAEANNMNLTFTVSDDPATAPAILSKYL